MEKTINDKKNLMPLIISKRNKRNYKNKDLLLSKNPKPFLKYNNKTLSNYNNYFLNLNLNLKDKTTSQSINKNKQISFNSILNSKTKNGNKNLDMNTLIRYNSMSPKTFSSLIKGKTNDNIKIEKKPLSIDEKNKLKLIIKNFQDNKITTNELYKLDRKYPLNSLTKSNFLFLSHENQKYKSKNNKKKKKENNNIFLTSSNMIGLFNIKTNKILDNSIKDMKFSKNMNEFRKQIINSYSDSDKKIGDLKKKKIYYNEALNIFEENDEKRIKEAQKLEENFYREKSTSFFKGKPLYFYIKEINKSMSKKNIEVDTDTDDTHQSQNFHRNNLFYTNYKYNSNKNNNNNNIMNRRLKTVQSEKKFEESKKHYEKYLRKKFRKKAKIFADSLYDIRDLPEKIRKKRNELNYFHLNMKNLRRIIQVNSIKKNLYSIEDDDLLIKNTKKLREEIRKTENNFYTVFKGKYTLDFLKGKVRPSTIQKLNIMKNSHFGIPC